MWDLSFHRRAQRACRNTKTVANAHNAIDNGDRKILGQCRILQSIIQQQHSRALLTGKRSTGDTVPRHNRWHMGRQKKGLIAALMRGMAQWINEDGATEFTAVPPADHKRPLAIVDQGFRKHKDHGCLACSTSCKIANANDRDVHAGTLSPHAPGGNRSVHPAQRP